MSRPLPNPIGLSFLDLISCVFGAVLMLYLLEDPIERPRTSESRLGFIELRTKTKDEKHGVRHGLRVVQPQGVNQSWDRTGGVVWLDTPNSVRGAFPQAIAPDARFEVFVFAFDGISAVNDPLPESVEAELLDASGKIGTVVLRRDQGYRARLSR